MKGAASVLLLVGLLGSALHTADAQSRAPLSEALQYERRGDIDKAVSVYRSVLRDDRTNAAAILGLERVYQSINSLDSLLPVLDSALDTDPRSRFVREVQLRVYSTLGRSEHVAATAAAWIELVPASPDPFRQWAFVIAQSGDLDQAMSILVAGRDRLGGNALAPEMARLHMAIGDWPSAAREWRTASVSNPGNAPAAISGLNQAPPTERDAVLRQLRMPEPEPEVKRIAAELLVSWGRAEEGWTLLESALPRNPRTAAAVVRAFAERARRQQTRESARARGKALARLAELTTGDESKQARLDAAQAFADAGELSAARRLLDRVQLATGSRTSDAASAMATVIRISAESGRLDEAERRFREWESRLGADDARKLREAISWGWVMQNQLDRAEALLAGDSTVNSLAVLGWIATYRGDLRGAIERFRAAGPYAQSREEATRRTTVLALIQRVEPDTVPALGMALLRLAQGDTTSAIGGLERVAMDIPVRGGRADVLALAGDLAVAQGSFERSETLLLASLAAEAEGPAAPGAEYALAVAYVALGRHEDAARTLEHLILTFTNSALLPQARRLLDQVRGVIPQSRSDETA